MELPCLSTVYLWGNPLASKPIKLVVQVCRLSFCPHCCNIYFAAFSLVCIGKIVYWCWIHGAWMSHFSSDEREERFSLACKVTRALLYISLPYAARKKSQWRLCNVNLFWVGRKRAKEKAKTMRELWTACLFNLLSKRKWGATNERWSYDRDCCIVI